MLKRTSFTVLAAILLTLFCELVLFAYYSISEGRIHSAAYYFSRDFYFDQARATCSWSDNVGLHPYTALRYVPSPSCPTSLTNSYGLMGSEIPFTKDDGLFHVLLLGTSVAEQVSNLLERELNLRYASPNMKPFKVLNLAMSGTNQPVGFIQAAHFMHLADLVVSLEGYNEHFRLGMGQQLEAPFQMWIEKAVASDHLLLHGLLKAVGATARLASASAFRYSFICFTALKGALARLQKAYQDVILETKVVPNLPANWSVEAKDRYFLESYKRYLLMTAGLLKLQAIPFVLFVQPAPIFKDRLTEEETARIGDLQSHVRYKRIVELMTSLPKDRIEVESLAEIYKANKEALYVDHIHTNTQGLEILASEMTRRLAKKYGWKTK